MFHVDRMFVKMLISLSTSLYYSCWHLSQGGIQVSVRTEEKMFIKIVRKDRDEKYVKLDSCY